MTIVDKDLRIVRVNPVFGVFGDQSPAQLIGKTIAEAVPLLAAQIVPATLSVLETGVPTIQELVKRDPGDPANTQYFRSIRCPVVAADGAVVGVVSTVIEITDLRNVQLARDDALARQRESDAAELASRRAEAEASARYRTIFEGASIGIIRVDRTGRVVEVNPALEAMLGYTAAELAAMKFQEYTHADDVEENLRQFDAIMNGPLHAYQFEKRCFRKDGEMIWVRVTSAAERDANGERNYAITMLEDITERKLAEARSREQARLNEHQATHDALTGLGNRRKLYGDVERALSDPGGRTFALGLYDLDGFKAYNDAFGHPAGDALLERLGRRTAAVIGTDATAYRMGGDEFCVFTWAPEPARVLENARLALCDQGEGFSIRCSRGTALLPSEAADLERALQLADERLYADKRTNRVSESRQVRDALVQLIAEQRHELSPEHGRTSPTSRRPRRACSASPARTSPARGSPPSCTTSARRRFPRRSSARPARSTPRSGTSCGGTASSASASWRRRPRSRRSRRSCARATSGPTARAIPTGSSTDEIPIAARIVAVVDAFDAMVSARPYKTAMSVTEAIAELHRCAGTQFDAGVIEAFTQVIAHAHADRRAA